MPKPQPKTNAQIRRMFGLAKEPALLGRYPLTKDYVEEIALATVGTARISELTFDQANAVIKALGGDPLSKRGLSRRTENYRKQQAGIKSIETENHLNFIDELARLRGMTPEGVEKLAIRMHVPWPPRTTEQGNKIVEALKAMNKRDGLAIPKSEIPNPKSADPTFRRVA